MQSVTVCLSVQNFTELPGGGDSAGPAQLEPPSREAKLRTSGLPSVAFSFVHFGYFHQFWCVEDCSPILLDVSVWSVPQIGMAPQLGSTTDSGGQAPVGRGHFEVTHTRLVGRQCIRLMVCEGILRGNYLRHRCQKTVVLVRVAAPCFQNLCVKLQRFQGRAANRFSKRKSVKRETVRIRSCLETLHFQGFEKSRVNLCPKDTSGRFGFWSRLSVLGTEIRVQHSASIRFLRWMLTR